MFLIIILVSLCTHSRNFQQRICWDERNTISISWCRVRHCVYVSWFSFMFNYFHLFVKFPQQIHIFWSFMVLNYFGLFVKLLQQIRKRPCSISWRLARNAVHIFRHLFFCVCEILTANLSKWKGYCMQMIQSLEPDVTRFNQWHSVAFTTPSLKKKREKKSGKKSGKYEQRFEPDVWLETLFIFSWFFLARVWKLLQRICWNWRGVCLILWTLDENTVHIYWNFV